jgi:hypothetical protein
MGGGGGEQQRDDGSIGLLVPSLVFCYCVYYAFDSVKSNPNPQCRPAALSVSSDDASAIVLGLIVSAYSLSWVSLRTAQSAKGILQTRRESASSADVPAEKRTKKKKKKKRTAKGANNNQIVREDSDDEETGGQTAAGIGVMEIEDGGEDGEEGGKRIDPEMEKDERETMNKKIWLFHFILSMGALYLGMILTQWGGFTGMTEDENLANQATALWVNAVGGWVAYAIFGWIRVAPLICPGRDFRDATDGF